MNIRRERSVQTFLDDGKPFVIWEKGKLKGHRRGMLVQTHLCQNPECDCRDIYVHAMALDDTFTDTELEDEKLTYQIDGAKITVKGPFPKKRLRCIVNVNTGNVSYEENAPSEDKDPELMAWLSRELKKDLLEVFQRRWRAAKQINRDQWREMDWSWWEPGEMVSWEEVFPDDDKFLFSLEGKSYFVDDMYCITPECKCKKIVLSFFEIGKKKTRDAGGVFVELPRLCVSDVEPLGVSRDMLLRLWDIFREEPNFKERVLERYKEMKVVGKEIARTPTADNIPIKSSTTKVGRNDPCPCGSGKKYKKCCLKR